MELDPANTNAQDVIKRLESEGKTIDASIFEGYVGQYESPIGVIMVSKQGDKLFVQPSFWSKEEMTPESETRFNVRSVGAVIVFASDGSGQMKMMVRLRGETFEAKKVK
ncbi:MAG TPA: hypothetical protein VGL29_24865 [Blastocatellia bacterium]